MVRAERIVIENGTVIDPSVNLDARRDLLLEDGRVLDIAAPGTFRGVVAAERIDATGLWVTPGFVDLHVHFREPGFEWKETIATGATAAALGGYTTVCCMANTNPVNDCEEVTQYIRSKARDIARTKVLPIGAVSVGLKGQNLAPLSELRGAGCVAFSDDGEPVYDAGLMRRALEWASMLDATICCHEEDKHLSAGGCMNESPRSYRMGLKGWPAVAEEVLIARDIELARATGARVHICHVSTARGVELIRRAKNDGIRITCEVTPHHLHLTEDAVEGYRTSAKMSPPLRLEADRIGVLEGLADGTIDALASDHAPHDNDSKEQEFSKASFGILGLQTSLPLMVELIERGVLSRQRAIASMCGAAAACLGLYAGRLIKGAAADCVLVDPKATWKFESSQIASKSKNSPFIGRELKGRAVATILDGIIVARNGAITDGGGR